MGAEDAKVRTTAVTGQRHQKQAASSQASSHPPSSGVGEGVGAGEGDSVSWSSVLRFLPSRDLAMTI